MIEEGKIDIEALEEFISNIDIFSELPANVITEMAKPMTLFRFDEGESLITKDKPARFMYLVFEGTVKVDLGDKSLSLPKGTVLGEMSLMSGERSTADVIAETDTRAFIINRPFFNKLVSDHAELESVMSVLMKSRKSDNQTDE